MDDAHPLPRWTVNIEMIGDALHIVELQTGGIVGIDPRLIRVTDAHHPRSRHVRVGQKSAHRDPSLPASQSCTQSELSAIHLEIAVSSWPPRLVVSTMRCSRLDRWASSIARFRMS